MTEKYEAELVEWDHISVCTEGMDETQKDTLKNVIYALTNQRPRDYWGTYIRNPMDFPLTSSSQSVCGCRNCYQKEE